jgi:hypothetical protein
MKNCFEICFKKIKQTCQDLKNDPKISGERMNVLMYQLT